MSLQLSLQLSLEHPLLLQVLPQLSLQLSLEHRLLLQSLLLQLLPQDHQLRLPLMLLVKMNSNQTVESWEELNLGNRPHPLFGLPCPTNRKLKSVSSKKIPICRWISRKWPPMTDYSGVTFNDRSFWSGLKRQIILEWPSTTDHSGVAFNDSSIWNCPQWGIILEWPLMTLVHGMRFTKPQISLHLSTLEFTFSKRIVLSSIYTRPLLLWTDNKTSIDLTFCESNSVFHCW